MEDEFERLNRNLRKCAKLVEHHYDLHDQLLRHTGTLIAESRLLLAESWDLLRRSGSSDHTS